MVICRPYYLQICFEVKAIFLFLLLCLICKVKGRTFTIFIKKWNGFAKINDELHNITIITTNSELEQVNIIWVDVYLNPVIEVYNKYFRLKQEKSTRFPSENRHIMSIF